MDTIEITKKLNEIVVDQFILDDDPKPEDKFVDDLGADSLDVTELIINVETEFGIAISDEEAFTITAFKNLVVLVDEKLNS